MIYLKKILFFALIAISQNVASSAESAPESIFNTTAPDGKAHTFSFGGPDNSEFLLDGKPFQIRSGEMHPQRIPKEYWRDRVQMAKAMGLNTVSMYAFWNGFEQPDGSLDFKSGRNDIAEFMKICEQEGMWVLFRPGPYVCGEWDFGGIPARLLKYPDLQIRTDKDARFMEAQTKYLKAIAEVAKPLRAQVGGPILMTQIENEYGSWQRIEKDYIRGLQDFWTQEGFAPLCAGDGWADHYLAYREGNTLPGVAVGLDPGEKAQHWENANKFAPGVPAFSSETYPGWLRHWGDGNWKANDKSKALKWYMEAGKSFNLYMFHGGTNFGYTAGANHGGPGNYRPDLTSYDYASPIDEQGQPTEAYQKYRQIIVDALGSKVKVPDVPKAPASMELQPFTPKRIGALGDLFPEAKPVSPDAMWFEAWEQNQGLARYTTTLPAGPATEFSFQNLNDYAQVYLDGKRIATVSRRDGRKDKDRRKGREGIREPISIPARDKPAKLEVIVEGMGHINFRIDMESDRKGLFGELKLGDQLLKDWKVAPLPLLEVPSADTQKNEEAQSKAGAHFRATLQIEGPPSDTFLDMSKYEKGMVWVNGHHLGRYWNIGPQQRLYCPASWLKSGENVIDIVDLELTEARPIRGCKTRNFDTVNADTKNTNNEW